VKIPRTVWNVYNKLGEPQHWKPGEKKTGPKWTLSKERGEMVRRLQALLDRYTFKFQFMVDRHVLAPAVPVLGGGAGNPNTVLSVTPDGTYESWNVLASEVKVVCVPREADYVKQYFAWLPEIDWEPE
jgi:hypothetical protein